MFVVGEEDGSMFVAAEEEVGSMIVAAKDGSMIVVAMTAAEDGSMLATAKLLLPSALVVLARN